jgi:hypothetical protein
MIAHRVVSITLEGFIQGVVYAILVRYTDLVWWFTKLTILLNQHIFILDC